MVPIWKFQFLIFFLTIQYKDMDIVDFWEK